MPGAKAARLSPPAASIRQTIAKRLGTKLVYTKGLECCERTPDSAIAEMALGYGCVDAKRDLRSLLDNADSTDKATQQDDHEPHRGSDRDRGPDHQPDCGSAREPIRPTIP